MAEKVEFREAAMNDIFKEMRGFLKASSYIEHPHPEQIPEQGLYPFITVSRECGTGGYQLAQTILACFEKERGRVFRGWQIFDRELCEKVVTDKELNRAVRDLLSQEYYSEIQALVYSLLGEPSQKTQVYKQLFDVIRTMATFGKVIIIGRAGSCITESLPLGVHVRLIAPLGTREKRLKDTGMKDPGRIIQQTDHDRARLIKVYFHKDINNPFLYDAVFNMGRLSFSEAAVAVTSLVKEKIAVSRTPA